LYTLILSAIPIISIPLVSAEGVDIPEQMMIDFMNRFITNVFIFSMTTNLFINTTTPKHTTVSDL